MKTLLLLASLAAAAGFGAYAHLSTTKAPSDTNGAIARYVAAEDNDFAEFRGALERSSTSAAYYTSRQTLPGASNCVVYDNNVAPRNHFGGCTFEAKSLQDATALYRRWLGNVRSALPQWKSANAVRPPSGDVAATIFSDESQVHAVFVDIFGDAQSGYRVDATFAKMSVLHS